MLDMAKPAGLSSPLLKGKHFPDDCMLVGISLLTTCDGFELVSDIGSKLLQDKSHVQYVNHLRNYLCFP